MKYYKCGASPSFVGANKEFKIKFEDNVPAQEIEDIIRDICVEHIENYEDPTEWEEEHGVEYEYQYWSAEIDEDQYNKLNWEEETI